MGGYGKRTLVDSKIEKYAACDGMQAAATEAAPR